MILLFRLGGHHVRVRVSDDREIGFCGPLQGENNFIGLRRMGELNGGGDVESLLMTEKIVRSLPSLVDVRDYVVLEFRRLGFVFVKEL